MFRVQYATDVPDTVIDADAFSGEEDGDFITFTNGGKFVAAVKSIAVLAILREQKTAGPFGGVA